MIVDAGLVQAEVAPRLPQGVVGGAVVGAIFGAGPETGCSVFCGGGETALCKAVTSVGVTARTASG